MQLELKLGLGGTSYEDFIRSVHLPMQLRYYHFSMVHSSTKDHLAREIKTDRP